MSAAMNGLVCTCLATMKPNEPMVVDKSHCPIHGRSAARRSLWTWLCGLRGHRVRYDVGCCYRGCKCGTVEK